jgi:hypothetical protein
VSQLKGQKELNRRLEALQKPRPLLQTVQLRAVAEAKQLHAPNRKTGHTSRTIMPGQLGPTFAIVQASGAAVFLERGTRPHIIRPKTKGMLSWPASSAGRRLSGRPRTNAGPRIFARMVRHPGTKPYPFLLPGAVKAVKSVGIEPLVKAWNEAA